MAREPVNFAEINSVYSTRRDNLRRLLDQYGGEMQRLAVALGYTNGSRLSQLIGPRPKQLIKEDAARSYEDRLSLPRGSLDEPHPQKGAPPAPTTVMEAAPSTYVRAPYTAHQPAGAALPVDGNLLAETVQTVLLEVNEMKIKPINDKVADIVTLAYAHAVEHKRCDPGYVHTLVNLMR